MIRFTVPGVPAPQGSMRALIPRGARFPVVISDNRNLKPWRQSVAFAAVEACPDRQLWQGPVSIGVVFYLPRPKSLPKRIVYPTKKPDCDKLVRGIFDALTGILWRDDSQVVEMAARKLYGDPPRAEITVQELPTALSAALSELTARKRGPVGTSGSTGRRSARKQRQGVTA